MREISLDGRQMTSRESTHALMKQMLDLPSYYGNNLDALHDCLTGIDYPTHIVLLHTTALLENLGSYGDIFLHVLSDIAEENDCITLTIRATQ